jgi:hypothetical protein
MAKRDEQPEETTSRAIEEGGGAAASDLLRDRAFSLQARFDAVDVLSGSRPAARLLLRRGGGAEAMTARLIASGCHIEVGPTLVRQRKPAPGSLFVDYIESGAEQVEEEYEDFVALYFSLTARSASQALAADLSGDDRKFGDSLGYPPCCVEAVHARGRVPAIHECYELYSSDGLYDPLTWPAAGALDAALAPHYPCGRDCARSIAIAELRFDALARSGHPVDQARVQKALSGTYVFGADKSIECVLDSAALTGRVARPMRNTISSTGRSC